MKVVIIGSGNVATVFGKVILAAGHEIIQVVGRDAEKANSLSSNLNSNYTTNLLNISSNSDIYIISVSDDSVNEIATSVKLKNKVVVHTAASVSKKVLKTCTDNYGVLYPLQTLRKEMTSIPVIPILVDGSNQQTKDFLLDFAAGISDNVLLASDEERLKLHVAAVFVNNFTNHLFSVSEKFCFDNKLDSSILKPLIKETILGVEEQFASAVQTGPAVRKDFRTIEKHQQILSNSPSVLKLYNVLTESIFKFYSENNV